ncbi:hypothetical protein PHPALM_27868 [Phytophthora palmivora]|uniref:Uncharacterized protein n=1 Tax=Phytophthora palmivora TaxID=4796 RepID=A0A2P4XBJ4_9STRA|nr:hypothetical protein PHPALM_27868 [Phytophthora palmivora]
MYHQLDSSWRRNSSRDDYHRDLLAKHITTVEALRRDMLDRRHKKTPLTAFREIPVPLLTGESFEQYKREFGKWLHTKNESFETLRNNPSRERNFWFSFAHQRVESVSHEAVGMKRTAPAYSYYGPHSLEDKRQKKDEKLSLPSTAPMLSQNSYSNQTTGGETMNKLQTDEPSSLQSADPMLHKNKTEITGSDGASISTEPKPPHSQPRDYTCYLPVPRDKYLAQRIVTPEAYVREITELKQKQISGVLDVNLAKIPVPLAPGKTVEAYEQSFRSWISKRKKPLESLYSNPVEERGLRCQFAMEKAFLVVDQRMTSLEPLFETHIDGQHSSDHLSQCHSQNGNTKKDSSVSNGRSAEQSCSHFATSNCVDDSAYSTNRLSRDDQRVDDSSTISENVSGKKQQILSLPETLPEWATQLIARVHELERKVARDKICNSTASVSKCTQSSVVEAKHDNRGKTQAERITELLELYSTSSADIHRDGVIILAGAVHSRVQESLVKKKLTKTYNCLNDQIVMNETAINDAAAYMKTIKDVDETMATEQQNQIMELVVSVNKEKEKRSAALAELIVQHWTIKSAIQWGEP